jgi:formate--tetrahydrofolate ligase
MLAENPEDVLIGAANLRKQLENIRAHGIEPVVAINAMPSDFRSERAAIAEVAASLGVRSAIGTHFADVGRGRDRRGGRRGHCATRPPPRSTWTTTATSSACTDDQRLKSAHIERTRLTLPPELARKGRAGGRPGQPASEWIT